MKTFTIILFILFFGLNIFGQTMNAAESELATLDRQIQDAIATGDTDIIERFVADDMIFIHGFFIIFFVVPEAFHDDPAGI